MDPCVEFFPFAGIPQNLLEKMVNKFDSKSYFRLRRTCKDIGEFIRTRGKVCLDCSIELKIDNRDSNSLQLCSRLLGNYKFLDDESLYGIKFRVICLIPEVGNYFDDLCVYLKKYRITTSTLLMDSTDQCTTLSKEQCCSVLKILKPQSLDISSIGSNRFEALPYCKTVKFAKVKVDVDNALTAMQKLFGKPQIIILDVDGERSFTLNEIRHIIREFLQFLHTHSLPRYCTFSFFAPCSEQMPPVDEQLKCFKEFNPSLERASCPILGDEIYFQLPNRPPCKLAMIKNFVKINYNPL